MATEFSNTAGQKSAPLSKRRVKDSELDKNMRNTVSAGAPSTKGTKFIPYDESKAAPVKEVVKNTRPKNLVDKEIANISPVKKSTTHPNDVEGTNRVTAPVSTKTASPAVTKTAAPVVKSAPVVTKTMSKPVVKSSPISSSYGSDEDAARQSSIDENYEFFKSRGAFKDNEGMKKGGSVKAKSTCMKSGGMVKSSASRGDGIAQRGKTRGRIC